MVQYAGHAKTVQTPWSSGEWMSAPGTNSSMQHGELLIWLDLLRIHKQVKNLLFFFALKSEACGIGGLDFCVCIYLLLTMANTS